MPRAAGSPVADGAMMRALASAAPTMGFNGSGASLQELCPARKYQRCFWRELNAKYPVTQFRLPPQPRRCGTYKGGAAMDDAGCALPSVERMLVQTGGPRMRLCPQPSSPRPSAASDRLRCNSPAEEINRRGVLLLGVPSSPTSTGFKRRSAIRESWMRDERVGVSVVVCFLLSYRTPDRQIAPMREEHTAHGDMLFLDAPETGWLITNFTKYSGGLRKGRGMPTFKQYAFFQHVTAMYPAVPFVGKIDDDTAPNLRALVPFLERLKCVESAAATAPPLLFIGAINFASYVPRSNEYGVRGDRCGFGWTLHAALANFGATFGTRGQPGFIEACDVRGGVLPFPYATGAGYLFSAELLRHVASSAEVSGWVADAAGPQHEALQWQKFEDTSTGYFVSHALRTVRYVDIGPLVHDIECHVEGERKRRGGGTYRPPANSSLFVHNLKGPSAFAFAWEHMQATTLPYDHARCVAQVKHGGKMDVSVGQRRPARSGAVGAGGRFQRKRRGRKAVNGAVGRRLQGFQEPMAKDRDWKKLLEIDLRDGGNPGIGRPPPKPRPPKPKGSRAAARGSVGRGGRGASRGRGTIERRAAKGRGGDDGKGSKLARIASNTVASALKSASALQKVFKGRGGGSGGGGSRTFQEIPLFMIEEEPSRLMKHAPPYGYKFGNGKRAFRPDELEAKRRNATLPSKRRFGSCAVVGSSGTLLHAKLGKEIDAHHAVFRVNGAPLGSHYANGGMKSYADVVGTRTTWRLFSSPHAASDYGFHEERAYPNQTMLVLCDRPYVYSCQNVLFARPKPYLHGINPRFYEAVRKHTDKRKSAIPLTGVVAVAIAMRSCDTVDVYGMSVMSRAKQACFYYWSCGRTDATYHSRPGDAQFHDFHGNAQALLRWNASGAIRLRA